MNTFFDLIILSAGIVILTTALVVAIIWIVAHTGRFFTFLEDGKGVLVVKGKRYHRSIIALRGYHLEYDERLNTERVTEGEERKNLVKYFFEDILGIYWVGFYPLFKIRVYEFKWKEWSLEEQEYRLTIRDEMTDFFFVRTFRYATFLQAAEAKGNVPVDVKFSLFVRIVAPEITFFRADDWFLQLDDYALRRARVYVGDREFDELRTETGPEHSHVFSEHIVELNEHTSGSEPGVIERLGVEIVSAQIVEVEVAGDEEEKKKTLAATTERYRKEQEGLGIRAIGTARADAIAAEGRAIAELGEIGVMLRKQQALEKAGELGNIVVFSESKGGEQTVDAQTLAGLVTAHLKKEDSDGNEEK